MMATEKAVIGQVYPLLTMLTGLISFLIGGILCGFFSLITNEGLILILGVPIGSILMLLPLRMFSRNHILLAVVRGELGVIAGMIAGFLVGYLLSWAISAVIPAFGDLTQVKVQIIPNLFLLVVANAVFGACMTELFYTRKAIPFFVLTGAIAAIPFGLLLSVPLDIAWLPFDRNLLIMVTSFGTSTGLAYGRYRLRNKTS